MEKVIVVRKGEKVKTTTLKGIRFNLLVKTDVLEAILHTYEPETSIGLTYKHMGQEVHILLKGEMEYEIENRTYLLKEGDVICFPSILSHTARNPGKEKAIGFAVVSPTTFM